MVSHEWSELLRKHDLPARVAFTINRRDGLKVPEPWLHCFKCNRVFSGPGDLAGHWSRSCSFEIAQDLDLLLRSLPELQRD